MSSLPRFGAVLGLGCALAVVAQGGRASSRRQPAAVPLGPTIEQPRNAGCVIEAIDERDDRRLAAAGELTAPDGDSGALGFSVLAAPFRGSTSKAYVPVILEVD